MKQVKLYALMLDGQVLDSKTFKKYWAKYGDNSLYGWRFPKKIYTSIGAAKNGLRFVPTEIKSKVELHEFSDSGIISI